MPNVTIQSSSVCAGGHHRTVVTDQGTFRITEDEITIARNDTIDELRQAFIDIVRHQYLSRKAAGRTHAQAMGDLIGFVARL